MSRTTDEQRSERERLQEEVRTADSTDERRAVLRRLAALDRERNRETYDKLADE